jgi:cytochrome c oxidase subunit 3
MSVLFGASLVAYLVTRFESTVWRTEDMPALPRGLFASTLMLVGLTAALHRAVAHARANRSESLLKSLWLGLAFAIAFLLGQAQNWRAMAPALHGPVQSHYPFTFYLLTGLHAAHVVGGFVPLGIVIARARGRRYTSSRHEGLSLCRQYWDYLFVVWVVLLGALLVAT